MWIFWLIMAATFAIFAWAAKMIWDNCKIIKELDRKKEKPPHSLKGTRLQFYPLEGTFREGAFKPVHHNPLQAALMSAAEKAKPPSKKDVIKFIQSLKTWSPPDTEKTETMEPIASREGKGKVQTE